MTDRRLGIEVDVSSKGDGLSRINRDAKDLNQTFKDFQDNLERIAKDLAENARRNEELAETYRFAERQMDKFSSEVERATDNLRGMRRPFNQIQEEAEQTETATTGVGYAFTQMAERAEKINKIIRPINTLRFHSTQLAEAAGLIEGKYDGAANSTQAFEQIADRLDLTISSLEKTIGRMNVGIETLNENMDKQHRKATAVGETFDVLGSEIQDSGEKAYYLNEALFESSQQLEIWKNKAEVAKLQAEAMQHEMHATGEETEELGSDFNKLGEHLERIAEQMDRSGDEAHQLDERMDRVAGSLDRVGDKLDHVANEAKEANKTMEAGSFIGEGFAEVFGNVVSDALEEALEYVVEFAQESVQAFYDFDRGTREIFTLLPEASDEMREALKEDVLELGTELGRLPEEMLPAVYDALSAGIPEDNVLSVVETASNAARAGVSELSDTLKLGVAVLNAQVTGVRDINDVYDQLFFTVKNGVVTMPELTQVMSQVTSIAGEAGVSMQDISSAMIVMTRQGDSAAEAAELLSIMLTQLSTSGTTMATTFEEAAGKSFRQFIAEGNTLADAMKILQDHASRTGQSLGDILGGGSPFFRDTQAARGALELTGKHLDELVRFANEAENAMGSMSEAAAEMGQAAEQNSLEAAASWKEMSIAVGEAYSQEAGIFYDLKQGFAEYLTADAKRRTAINDSRAALEALGSEGEVLRGRLGAIHKGTLLWRDSMVDAEEMALRTEIAVRLLENGFTGGSKELEQLIDETYEEEKALQTLEKGMAASEAATKEYGEAAKSSDQALLNFNRTTELATASTDKFQEVNHFNAATMRGGTEATQAATAAQVELNEKIEHSAKLRVAESEALQNQTFFIHDLMTAKQAETEADATRMAAMAAYSATLQANIEAERAKVEELRVSYSNYALNADTASYATTNWTNELFNAAAQQGLTQEQIILLAAATGEYSDEQVQAMLKTAAMSVAVDQLAQALAAGDITTADAVASLRDFESQLDKDYKLEFNYKDLDGAKTSANNAHDAFVRAAGNFKATFTTHNITINETIDKVKKDKTSGSDVPGKHLGGAFGAHELMLVGDGPGGKFIPGVSEYVMFDRPGTVIGAADSAQLFRGQAVPPGVGAANPAFNEFAPHPTNAGVVNVQIIINAQPGADLTGITEDSMREAARKAGLVE